MGTLFLSTEITSVIDVVSTNAELNLWPSRFHESSALQITSTEALLSLRIGIEPQASFIEVNGYAADIRIKNGRISATFSTINICSGFTSMRSGGVGEFPPLEPINPAPAPPVYPSLRPTSRQFTPPSHAVSTIHTINNKAVRYLNASKPGGGTLELVYENISDALSRGFIVAYENCLGSTKTFSLPDDFYAGLDDDLLLYVKFNQSSLAWRWQGPPKIESNNSNVNTVTVQLSASTIQWNITAPATAPVKPYLPDDISDSTRYDSFGGVEITPPTPITPTYGNKWLAYSPISYSDNGHSAPAFDQNGFCFYCRGTSSRIEINKISPDGAFIWRKTIFPFADPEELGNGEVVSFGGAPGIAQTEDGRFMLYTTCNRKNANFAYLFIGFDSVGNILYKRYHETVIEYLPSFVYHPGKNLFIGTVLWQFSQTVRVVGISPDTGVMQKRVALASPASEFGGSNGSWCHIKQNGSIVTGGPGIAIMINPNMTDVISAKKYQGGAVGGLYNSGSSTNDIYMKMFDTNAGGYGRIAKLDQALQPEIFYQTNTFNPYIQHDSGNNFFVWSNGSLNTLYNVDFYNVKLNWSLYNSREEGRTIPANFAIDKTRRILLSTPSPSGYSGLPQNTSYTYLSKCNFLLPPNSPTLATPSPPDLRLKASTYYPGPSDNFISIESSPSIYTTSIDIQLIEYPSLYGTSCRLGSDYEASYYGVVSDA